MGKVRDCVEGFIFCIVLSVWCCVGKCSGFGLYLGFGRGISGGALCRVLLEGLLYLAG